jgi:hypothetical protein
MFFFMALPSDFEAKDTRSAPGPLRHSPHIGSDAMYLETIRPDFYTLKRKWMTSPSRTV